MSNEFELFRDEVSSLIYMQAGKIETVRGLEFLDKIPEQELRDILSKTYVNIRKDLLNSKEKFEHPLGQYKNYNDFLISTGTVKLELNPNQPFYGTKFKLEGLLQAESINDIIQDSLEDEDFTDEDDIEPFAFKLGQRIESIEEEKGWIKQRLPKIPVQDIFVFKKLTGIDNPDIIGVFYNAAIYLSEYGERGTGYHEAFHAVFRLYLSETEREDLYNQIRTELGNERDWSKIAKLRSAYPELSGNELNLLYLEEELADKFQEYVLTKRERVKALDYQIFKALRNLVNEGKLNSITDANIQLVDNIYSDIKTKYEEDIKNKPSRKELQKVINNWDDFVSLSKESL